MSLTIRNRSYSVARNVMNRTILISVENYGTFEIDEVAFYKYTPEQILEQMLEAANGKTATVCRQLEQFQQTPEIQ